MDDKKYLWRYVYTCTSIDNNTDKIEVQKGYLSKDGCKFVPCDDNGEMKRFESYPYHDDDPFVVILSERNDEAAIKRLKNNMQTELIYIKAFTNLLETRVSNQDFSVEEI